MTRPFPRWPLAIALLFTGVGAVAAQAPTPMVPDMPPPPQILPTAPPAAPPPTTPAPPGVAAIVNGKRITRTQVASEALKVAGPQILSQLILIELINQEAAKQHVVVTPAQLDARLAETRQEMRDRVPGGLDTLLAQRHQTIADYKGQMQIELKVEALVAKTLPPVPSTLKYHARHLLILTTNANPQAAPGAKPPHTDEEAKALIAKAQAEIKAGKSFEEVADKYTEDPTNKDAATGKGKGGELGIIDAQTQFDPDFLKAALALKPGQVTPEPVKSVYGYHLIKIDSTSAKPSASEKKIYDESALADRRQQMQQAIPTYVQNLRTKAQITDYLSGPQP